MGEIILVDNNPDTLFSFVHPKVFTFQTTFLFDTYAMTDRFKACLLSTLEWCLLVDDDLLVTLEGIYRLMSHKMKEPDRVYSFMGNARKYNDSDPVYAFCCTREWGEVPMVVGRTMFIDKRMARLFFDLKGVMDDVAYQGHTPWGAEDIYMSLIVRAKTGKQAYVLRPIGENPEKRTKEYVNMKAGSVGISASKDHMPFRNLFLRTALTRLHCLFPHNIPAFVDTLHVKMPKPEEGDPPKAKRPSYPPTENPATGLARWAVLTATSPTRAGLFNSTRAWMMKYASAVEADFISLQMSMPARVTGVVRLHQEQFKRGRIDPYVTKLLAIGRLLEVGYERVLWLDDSALVLPGCENLFRGKMTMGVDVAGFDESSRPTMRSYKVDREYLLNARNLSIPETEPYLNTGVLLVGQAMREPLQPMAIIQQIELMFSPYPTQCLLSYLLATMEPRPQVARLPERFNYMGVEAYDGRPNKTQEFSPERMNALCKQGIVHLTGHYVNRMRLVPQLAAACAAKAANNTKKGGG